MSADGLTLFFGTDRVGGYGAYDIWMTTRVAVNEPWGEPINLGAPVNSTGYDFAPSISADGLDLYFGSNRNGYFDLWVATRATPEHDWDTPVRLPATVTGAGITEAGPSISADGLSLFFKAFERPGGHGGDDLWVTTRPTRSDPWGSPINLGSTVNSSHHDHAPSISSDGLSLYFGSNRPGGYGDWDLYVTTRATAEDEWGSPVNLGPTVNTLSSEAIPCISFGAQALYFATYPKPRGGVGRSDLWKVPILPVVDFTGDFQVGIEDLLILIEHWGQNEPSVDMGPTPFGDGVVNVLDLEVLMNYWGQELPDPALLAHWALDETEGDIAYDSAGVNDGVLNGDPLWQSSQGMKEGALQFDGQDDHVSTNPALNPAEMPFSVFAWVKGAVPEQVIISQQDGADWLLTDSQGCLMTNLESGGRGRGGPLMSEMLIADDNWHCIGLVWDGLDRILYVDEIEVGRDRQAGLMDAYSGFHIGAGHDLDPRSFWAGMIDDVRIYDRVVIP